MIIRFALALAIIAASVPVSAQTLVRENLGQSVNSRYDEFSPTISPDGKTLFFSRGGSPENLGYARLRNDDDIWYSELGKDSTWSEAKHLGVPLNSKNLDLMYSIT